MLDIYKKNMDLYDKLKARYMPIIGKKQYNDKGCQYLYSSLYELHNNGLIRNEKYLHYICALDKIDYSITKANNNKISILKDIPLSLIDDKLTEFQEL